MTGSSGRANLLAALALGAIAGSSEWLRGLAGQLALYPLLGAFPGLALSWALLPRASATTRWIVGLALAPLVSSLAGWLLIGRGLEPAFVTRAIGIAGALAWAAQLLRPSPSPGDPGGEDTPPSGALWALSLGLAAAIALPHFLNPWMLIKSDAWNHAGIVYQILERGMPPEDPRFAGLHLNYVWFFNLFIGMLSSVHDGNPFVFMTLLNVVDVALLAWVAYLAGWMLWRNREGAVGAALLTCFGFNALTWLLWPLNGLRAVFGHDRGWEGLRAAYRMPHFNNWLIMADLSPPYGVIENFADKFVTGTSINYTWLLMTLYLWAVVRLLRGAHRGAWWIALLATSGMQLWHGVVGLSVTPVALSALGLTLALRFRADWLPRTSRLIDATAATLLGFLATLPYVISISRGWNPGRSGLHVSPFHFDRVILVTLVLSCALATALAWRPMREALRERRADAAWLVIYAAGIYAFSILVQLPSHNEVKFAFEAFVPLALFGGTQFLPALRSVRARFGAAAIAITAALLAVPLVLTLVGFTLDPERRIAPAMNPVPGENQLYAWIQTHTPRDMVFVDDRFRDLIMVRARRQLYLGSSSGPERAAFPLQQVIERRAVMADLFGPARDLPGDAEALARLGRPAAIVYRSQDVAAGARPGAALEARPDLFLRIYDRDGFVLYAVRMPKAAASGAARP